MVKFVLISLLVAGLMITSGFNIVAHLPTTIVAGHIYAHTASSGTHGHSHDDEDSAQTETGHEKDHDPADHSHQVLFHHPESGNEIPRRRSGWSSVLSPALAVDNSARIHRPPQVS